MNPVSWMTMAHSHAHHDHDHGHAHGHGHSSGEATRRALTVALVLNGAFLVVEAALGWLTGSLALLSDAAHMLSDVGALALALGAAWLSQGAASPGRSFGWRRAETLGAFTNGVVLLGACAWLFAEAARRLMGTPPEVSPLPVLIAGSLGLAINLGSALALWRADRGNLGVRAALTHMLADALGSVGAILSALLLYRGIWAADALVSLFIGALVLWSTVSLLREAGGVLLQFAPSGVSAEAVTASLRALPGVSDVHHLHIWTLDGRTAVLSAHLVPAPGQPADALRQAAEELLLDRYRIHDTTLQVEGASSCARHDCALRPMERDHAHG